MRVLLVHNPKSGDDDHGQEQLVRLIAAAGHHVSYQRSKGAWQAALDDGPDLIVAAGGDGTVSEVARAVAGRGVPIAVLPLGTANNIAGWLGVMGVPLDDLIHRWTDADVQPFDIGIARGPWGERIFLESVGAGLLAGMISEIDAGGSRYVNRLDGRDARIGAALDVLERLLCQVRPVACAMQLDGEDISGEYLLVEILNFGAAGPNLRLAPDAHAADAVLDVVLIAADDQEALRDHLAALRGGARSPARLNVRHARHVVLHCNRCHFHIDDEPWAVAEARMTANIGTRHAAINFLVPRVTVSPQLGG
jgi:diacylglycerol kinase family enzyme